MGKEEGQPKVVFRATKRAGGEGHCAADRATDCAASEGAGGVGGGGMGGDGSGNGDKPVKKKKKPKLDNAK